MSAPAGHLRGGDTLRLLHGHTDESLTVPAAGCGEEERRSVTGALSHYHFKPVPVGNVHLWLSLTYTYLF